MNSEEAHFRIDPDKMPIRQSLDANLSFIDVNRHKQYFYKKTGSVSKRIFNKIMIICFGRFHSNLRNVGRPEQVNMQLNIQGGTKDLFASSNNT